MNELLAQLTASAKRLGVDVHSDLFESALEAASYAFLEGRGVDASFELARTVLASGSASGRAVAALTAA